MIFPGFLGSGFLWASSGLGHWQRQIESGPERLSVGDGIRRVLVCWVCFKFTMGPEAILRLIGCDLVLRLSLCTYFRGFQPVCTQQFLPCPLKSQIQKSTPATKHATYDAAYHLDAGTRSLPTKAPPRCQMR